MTLLDQPSLPTPERARERRLLVTRRPVDQSGGPRPYRAIGFLTMSADRHFIFEYLPSAVDDASFVPLAGFSDPTRTYRSESLFPAFAQRVMSAQRPDRSRFLAAIDLAGDSDAWEILSRSGGRRGGDTIEVMEEPLVDADGSTQCTFLVHGIRHQGEAATDRIERLEVGDELQLRVEPENPVNCRAVLVTAEQQALGHVPDPLVDYVHRLMSRDHVLRVVRANGRDVSPHLRLLVQATGTVDPDYRPFS